MTLTKRFSITVTLTTLYLELKVSMIVDTRTGCKYPYKFVLSLKPFSVIT